MRGKIEQRDGFAAALGHRDIFGKIPGGWIVEGDLFAVHHVRQEQRREDLGDRSDFEDRISIERAWIAVGEVAIGDDAAAIRFDDAHDNADRLLLLINSSDEDLADVVAARNCKWLRNIQIHRYTGPHKTQTSLTRHTSAAMPKLLSKERVGLARTGGKQALLTCADHRSIDLAGFVLHNGDASFRRLS